jgi:hypothetical protein
LVSPDAHIAIDMGIETQRAGSGKGADNRPLFYELESIELLASKVYNEHSGS